MDQQNFKYDETTRQIIYKNLSMSMAICIKQGCNPEETKNKILIILEHMVHNSMEDYNFLSDKLFNDLKQLNK